jgi:hypothetical protein
MKPGRELDVLIAEKVFGLNLYDRFTGEEKPITATQALAYASNLDRIPPFSTDIAAAWMVVEKLKELNRDILPADRETDLELKFALHSDGIRIQYDRVDKKWEVCWWEVGFYEADSESFMVKADTAPHAICLAALSVVGHEFKE